MLKVTLKHRVRKTSAAEISARRTAAELMVMKERDTHN
jgi:hypothetical protein